MAPTLNLPEEKFQRPQFIQQGIASTMSVNELFSQALESPIEFPPLNKVVFEGDSIALVVLNDLHNSRLSLSSLLESMSQVLCKSKICVVSAMRSTLNTADQNNLVEKCLEMKIELSFHVHDPDDKESVAYIAASYSGEPLYINRTIFNADTVIPLGSPNSSNNGLTLPIYPEFSTQEIRTRFHDSTDSREQLAAEIRLANAAIGANFAIQVVAGPGGEIQDVFAGEQFAVAEKAVEKSSASWNFDRLPDGEVVIATNESDATTQTWDQFFQAVVAAAAATENIRQIVICTQLKEPPNQEQQQILQLQFETDHDQINKQLKSTTDMLRKIPGILEDVTVYLQSQLSRAQVENLGLGYIATDEELQRIVDQAESGVYLRDAHLCKIV